MKQFPRSSRAEDGGSGTEAGNGTRSGLWRRLSLFGLLVALPVILLAVFTEGSGDSGGSAEQTSAEGGTSVAGTRAEAGEGSGGDAHADHGGKADAADKNAQGAGHEKHAAGGKCAVDVKTTPKGDGYRAKVTVTNSGETEIGNWMMHSSISPDANIEKHWRTVLNGYGLAVAFGSTDKNGTLEPGESTTFGFLVKNGTPPPAEANVCYVH
ncbi:cellulose binding domain-containing protein [Streptomyces sp. F63]|uniref:cellulose binding domain-containing protein n=1 Tax=Streptomyces sp. F63 TaxID=2824887 RepID=UPI001B38828A|nr:cellulose binding domain-containing protein [Streptomyces sp. F63]MBQ0988412.1 cellulose binding domain-containing protein [Streptomyces sp. F63]